MAKDYTPECKACFDRGQQQIKEVAELLKTAIPAKGFDIELCKDTSSFAEIGEISFSLGTNRFRLKFRGIGGSTWNTRLANWMRYKVDISNYGRFHDAQVFEKAGKLDYQKILAVIKERHEEYNDKQTLTSLDADRLERILTALTIHHAK